MEADTSSEPIVKNKLKKTFSGIKKLLKVDKRPLRVPGPVKKAVSAKDTKNTGVVYIGHIPHGFFEDELRGFFTQFGKVTNVRVARSKKNGHSKGYAFVEFQEREVAEIAAETMNNYLMDKRLLKAECIPPERVMPNLFKGKNWVENKKCPGIKNREKSIKAFNKKRSNEEYIAYAKKQLNKLHKLKLKLKADGIDFDFTPDDIPKELIDYDPSNKTNKDDEKSSLKTSSIANDSNESSEDDEESEESMIQDENAKKNFVSLKKQAKSKPIRKHIGVRAPSKLKNEDSKLKKKRATSTEKNEISKGIKKRKPQPLMLRNVAQKKTKNILKIK